MSDNNRSTKYAPDALPESITRKLFVRYAIAGYSAGRIYIWDTDYDQSDTVPICETEVTIAIPAIDHDGLKSKAVEVLQAELQKVRAENHMKEKAIQDKIDNLLAIEYKQEGDAA